MAIGGTFASVTVAAAEARAVECTTCDAGNAALDAHRMVEARRGPKTKGRLRRPRRSVLGWGRSPPTGGGPIVEPRGRYGGPRGELTAWRGRHWGTRPQTEGRHRRAALAAGMGVHRGIGRCQCLVRLLVGTCNQFDPAVGATLNDRTRGLVQPWRPCVRSPAVAKLRYAE